MGLIITPEQYERRRQPKYGARLVSAVKTCAVGAYLPSVGATKSLIGRRQLGGLIPTTIMRGTSVCGYFTGANGSYERVSIAGSADDAFPRGGTVVVVAAVRPDWDWNWALAVRDTGANNGHVALWIDRSSGQHSVRGNYVASGGSNTSVPVYVSGVETVAGVGYPIERDRMYSFVMPFGATDAGFYDFQFGAGPGGANALNCDIAFGLLLNVRLGPAVARAVSRNAFMLLA